MKANFICIKLSKIIKPLLLILLIIIIFIVIYTKMITKKEEDIIVIENNMVTEENIKYEENEKIDNVEELKEYENMPREMKGYKIVGKLEIPKINLNTYVLSETNTNSLKVSVTKLCGPSANKVGNFCIAGHNYRNMKMFGGIKKLEIDDELYLTDTYDRKVMYKVYATYKTSPKDTSCLNQDTGGDREITLITCTAGAIERVVVKCVEVYD